MMKIKLGQVVMTRGIANLVEENDIFSARVIQALAKHQNGDWGECSIEDTEANNWSAENGERILSVYTICGTKTWIITERDRSVTTILFPDEY